MSFAVRARLGSLQTGANEQFIPLVAQEILAASSNPAGDGLSKPLLEWDDEVLDQLNEGFREDRAVDKLRASIPHAPTATANPPLDMIDSPSAFDTRERWEQYLKDLQALPPDTVRRQERIDRAERIIAQKRRGG